MFVKMRFPLILILIGIALGSLMVSISKGSTPIPLYQLMFSDNGQFNTIFFELRLPRTLTAFVTGGLLALAGSLMQVLLQNPLADPYALGVSGGAAFFTLLLMLLGMSELSILGGAWFGSLCTIALMTLLARQHGWQTHTLLLSGIAIACAFSAAISCLLLLSPNNSLHSMLFWLSGDLNDAHMPWLGGSILCAGMLLCALLAPGLNVLMRGDKEAAALGLASQRYRCILYLLSSLLTATAVTLAGCIGFIGLIIPHFARRLAGFDHQHTLPVSVLLGGSLLTLADTGARTWFAPQQIPVGVLTALIGIPIFIWLLRK